MKRLKILALTVLFSLCGAVNTLSYAQDMQAQIEELQQQIKTFTGEDGLDSAPQKNDTNLQRRLFIVQLYMVNDSNSVLKKLDELCGIETKHCQFLSEYWRVAALKSCIEFNRYTLQDMSSFETISEQQQVFFMNSIEQCNINYYIDHWDDIANNIDEVLILAKREMSKNEQE